MTQNEIFRTLPPFIKDFIYKNGWKELNKSQISAFNVIYQTNKNLVICSETAGGKTEAALFPILTQMHNEGEENVLCLYISPLKALINDQHSRMNELLFDSGISVFHWHGDVDAAKKSDFLKKPRGLLQITPESLESMLINRPNDISRIFSNLKYVIIDEVHTLMGNDRGSQIICQLSRISEKISYFPRRIALSATIGNVENAAKWLSDGTNAETETIFIPKENIEWKIGLEAFYQTENSKDGLCDLATDTIYNATKGKKCIVFSNSREETEDITASLRILAEKRKEPDRFYIHHGNLSKEIREETEFELKNSERDICAAATVTLELGIDVGKLERIINQGTPMSVGDFLQRLGRSGRRGNDPEMFMIFRIEESLPYAPFYELIPWELIQAIAIIELYLKDRFIESPERKKYPASLIFFETLSVVTSSSGIRPQELARKILSMPPFLSFPQSDYRTILTDMIKKDYLEITEDNEIVLGAKGEKLTNSFKFYAVFKDSEDFGVHCGAEMIGTISFAPPCGERFALAGRVWEVEETDIIKRTVFVHQSEGKMKVSWPGGIGDVDDRILEKMREILLSKEEYPYLLPKAKELLKTSRSIVEKTGMCRKNIIRLSETDFVFFPWLGSKGFETIKRIIKSKLKGIKIFDVDSSFVYYITFKCENADEKMIADSLFAYIDNGKIDLSSLVSKNEYPAIDKYDLMLPREILVNAFCENRLTLKNVENRICEIRNDFK